MGSEYAAAFAWCSIPLPIETTLGWPKPSRSRCEVASICSTHSHSHQLGTNAEIRACLAPSLHRGKPTMSGGIGIIRSPIRTSILPNRGRRRRRLKSVHSNRGLSHENCNNAGAESVTMVEGNMCGTAMRCGVLWQGRRPLTHERLPLALSLLRMAETT